MSSSSPTEKDRPHSAESAEIESSSSGAEEAQPVTRTKKKSKQTKKKSGGGGQLSSLPALDQLPTSGVENTANNALSGVTNTMGSVANNTVDQTQGDGGGGGGKSDTLRLRLDLNLDIEITLKAKIHGDLELALLN